MGLCKHAVAYTNYVGSHNECVLFTSCNNSIGTNLEISHSVQASFYCRRRRVIRPIRQLAADSPLLVVLLLLTTWPISRILIQFHIISSNHDAPFRGVSFVHELQDQMPGGMLLYLISHKIPQQKKDFATLFPRTYPARVPAKVFEGRIFGLK